MLHSRDHINTEPNSGVYTRAYLFAGDIRAHLHASAARHDHSSTVAAQGPPPDDTSDVKRHALVMDIMAKK